MSKRVRKVRVITCAWCGAVYSSDDGRYKYCSAECAREAKLDKDRKAFRVIYTERHEEELERYRRYREENREAFNARCAAANRKRRAKERALKNESD